MELATLGAGLAAVRSATLTELAEATGVPIVEVRLALRRLAEQLEPTGMQILDDGSHVQLAPDKRFHGAVAHLLQPEQRPWLSQEQAEVLAVVIANGIASRRRNRGGAGCAAAVDWSRRLGLAAPRQFANDRLLLSRGLLYAVRGDHATGRPLVCRPTPRLLQLLGAETL